MKPHQSRPAPVPLRLRADMLRGNSLQLAAALLLALLATAATLAVPLLVKEIIDSLAGHKSMVLPVALMASAALGGAVASALSGYILARIGEFVILRLRRRVIAHALRLPLGTVLAQGAGNLVARITSDAMLLRAVIDVGVVQLPLAVLTVVFTVIVMAILDWVLVLVTVASFAIAGAVIGMFLVRVRRTIIDQQTAIGDLAQRFTAHLAALTTIKAFQSEDLAAQRLGDEAARLTRTSLAGARLQSVIAPVMGLGQQVALVSVIIVGGARLAHGHLSTPTFAAFLLYLLQLVLPVTMVATGIGRLQAGLAARTRFNELLALPEETYDAAPGVPAPHPLGSDGAVVFQDVVFSYNGPQVLNGLSFVAPRYGLTALVGPSGAGKTTALALIDRFVHADQGQVRVLGHDIGSWSLAELRRRITYVDQQFTLLEGTVRENLELGRTQPASDAELVTALTAVGLRDDILALPDGLDTILGREHDLSGGQRQRLALARALLADADIILLDEPTSQLDSLNEKRFRQLVDDLAASRAVLVVAHRLSTVWHADRIVMMAAGTLVDAGTHDELMGRCGPYRELVAGQAFDGAVPVAAG